jgi:NAD(P)H dehydrogenase (quinone)
MRRAGLPACWRSPDLKVSGTASVTPEAVRLPRCTQGNVKGLKLSKILVTGASGHLGRQTVLALLKQRSPSDIVALVREPAKAEDLTALGVDVRQGDYHDRASLTPAMQGIEKVMLTSAHAFTDRNEAHGNVIDAAVEAGVKHAVFMSIIRNTSFSMKAITEDDLFAEEKLKLSGLDWTIARHPPFLDVLGFYIGMKAHETGIKILEGDGKFAPATRDDLAQAHAAILITDGQAGKEYALSGDPLVSFRDIAKILSDITGKEVPYTTVSAEEYVEHLKASAGVPDFIAEFALEWVQGINDGEWQVQTSDLETLLGRKPTTAAEFYRDVYVPNAPK